MQESSLTVIESEQLTVAEQSELQECEAIIERGLVTFVEVGSALLVIRDHRLYRVIHNTFEAYCLEKWGVERAHAYRLIDSAKVVQNLSPMGDILPTSERQARELVGLAPDMQREVWQEVVESTPNGSITAAKVAEVVQRKTHVSNNSGNNEWYTPSRFIDAARLVMGSIDCDPASSVIANETVKAAKFYSKEDNGLEKQWNGNVWMNPPYAQPLIGEFAEAVADKYDSEEITQAIVLVNNATETEWFSKIAGSASAICFPSSRVKFIDPDGNASGAPLQGQALFYLGQHAAKFIRTFKPIGIVCELC